MKKSIILLMFCAIQSVICVRRAPALEPKVYERYRVDSSMKALLDEHKDELIKAFEKCDPQVCKKKNKVYEFPWLPGYLVKKRISRINGVERLLRSIKEHNLDLIVIPEKKIYEIDGYGPVIIVPKIEAISRSPFTLRQVQQLWKLIEEAKYCDTNPSNYLFMADDKIAIIDTEKRSFHSNGFRGFARLLRIHRPYNYTDDAFRFVLENFRKYIPDDVHNIPKNILKKTGMNKRKRSYPRIYQQIEKRLRNNPDVFEWDYYSYFKEHYPNPFEDSNQ